MLKLSTCLKYGGGENWVEVTKTIGFKQIRFSKQFFYMCVTMLGYLGEY